VEFVAVVWPMTVSVLNTLSCHWCTWMSYGFANVDTETFPFLGIYNWKCKTEYATVQAYNSQSRRLSRRLYPTRRVKARRVIMSAQV